MRAICAHMGDLTLEQQRDQLMTAVSACTSAALGSVGPVSFAAADAHGYASTQVVHFLWYFTEDKRGQRWRLLHKSI